MIPSPAYFPTSLQERAAWYKNFADVIQLIGASLGLTPAEIAQIVADDAMMQFLAAYDVTLNEYTSGVRSYRKVVTEGDIGGPAAVFPSDLTPTVPAAVPSGIFERLDAFVRRIRAAAAYTPVIGAQLGIIRKDVKGGEGAEGSQKPKISADVDPGNVVLVKFVRSGFDGVLIQTQLDNDATWNDAGRYIKSRAAITIPQNTEHLPRSVKVRARFLDGNDPVGDWSDIVVVQTMP